MAIKYPSARARMPEAGVNNTLIKAETAVYDSYQEDITLPVMTYLEGYNQDLKLPKTGFPDVPPPPPIIGQGMDYTNPVSKPHILIIS